MSLFGATHALGSSIIDGSYLDAGWAAPGGDHLFTGSRTPGKGCAAPAAPRKCALLGAQSEAGAGDRMASTDGLQAVENRGVRTVNAGLCATASPSVGPGEANFFPYLSIQLPTVGDHLWVGDHSLSSGLESAGVDAVVALGRVARTPVPAGRLRPE